MKLKELFEDEERSVLSVMGEQPEHYEGSFDCSDHRLSSMVGSPKNIQQSAYFNRNNFSSFEGAPSIIGNSLHCRFNDFVSLHNIHKHIKHIGGDAFFEGNYTKSHVLGLLLIDGLQHVYFDITSNCRRVEAILNKHLGRDRDIFACQEELIENGLDEFAKL